MLCHGFLYYHEVKQEGMSFEVNIFFMCQTFGTKQSTQYFAYIRQAKQSIELSQLRNRKNLKGPLKLFSLPTMLKICLFPSAKIALNDY